jgi:hypothetical protein
VIELDIRVVSEVLVPAADKATNLDGYSYYSHGLDVLAGWKARRRRSPNPNTSHRFPFLSPSSGLHSSFSISSPSR